MHTNSPESTTDDIALRVDNVVKHYSGGVTALNGVSFEIPRGGFYGLLGPNGAGKTTLIRAITNLVRITSGQMSVFGHNTGTHGVEARRLVGVAPQEVNLDRFLTIRETLTYAGGYHGMRMSAARSRADELIEQFGLADKAHVRSPRLSGGMKRRVLLAKAFVHSPPLVILDEPTAGVDVELRHHLWRYIARMRDEGTTVLLTTHYLEEAERLCDQIAFLQLGTIIERGTPSELLRTHNEPSLEHLYLSIMGVESV